MRSLDYFSWPAVGSVNDPDTSNIHRPGTPTLLVDVRLAKAGVIDPGRGKNVSPSPALNPAFMKVMIWNNNNDDDI